MSEIDAASDSRKSQNMAELKDTQLRLQGLSRLGASIRTLAYALGNVNSPRKASHELFDLHCALEDRSMQIFRDQSNPTYLTDEECGQFWDRYNSICASVNGDRLEAPNVDRFNRPKLSGHEALVRSKLQQRADDLYSEYSQRLEQLPLREGYWMIRDPEYETRTKQLADEYKDVMHGIHATQRKIVRIEFPGEIDPEDEVDLPPPCA